MEKTNYNLSQTFEILGQWTPDYRHFEDAIAGTLHYNPEGIRLEIYGAFAGETPLDQLYGFTQNGESIWISGLVSKQENPKTPGYSVKEYTVRDCFIFEEDLGLFQNERSEVFTKIFKESPAEFRVSALSFTTNHLLEWFGKGLMYGDTAEVLTVPYGLLERREFSYNGRSLITELRQEKRVTDQQKIEITSAPRIVLKNDARESVFFKALYHEALNVKKLIELFCEDYDFFDTVNFHLAGEASGISGQYIPNQRGSRKSSLFSDDYLSFSDLEDTFDEILANYSQKSEKLDLVVDTYLNEFYLNENMETKLLNTIRNLEVYHRNFIEGNLPEHADVALEIEREYINQFIDDHVAADYQVGFRAQVNYAPEKNLRKRLQELLKTLPDALFEQLGLGKETERKSRSISSFAYKLGETRNYYTHRDSPAKYPGRLIEWDALAKANSTLRKIGLYYIYYELSVDEELILKALK